SSRNPLFQVMFVLQNAPFPAVSVGDLSLEPLDLSPDFVKFDLVLNCIESDKGLQLILAYRTDLFKPATIARMLGHLNILLESMVSQPDLPIAKAPFLSQEQE